MKTEYIIVDNTILRENAANPIESRIIYAGRRLWVNKLKSAKVFTKLSNAIKVAKKLHSVLPVRLLLLETNGNRINVSEVAF